MIVWNEDYSTGLETVDQQHKMLIDQINQLEEMLKNTNPTEKEIKFAHGLVQFLEQYADMHFKFEESCMEVHRCPAHALNKQQHVQFMEFFVPFKKKFHAQGFSVETFKELYQMTNSWITSHILRVDAQLYPCVRSPHPS